jgi:hypothetical protein
MNRTQAIILAAASAVSLSVGSGFALAQSVSDNDPYQQGFAAGTAAKARNNLNTFDNGYQAGEAAEGSAFRQTSSQAYDNGYQAGLVEGGRASEEAYNEGYQDRAVQDRTTNADAFHSSDSRAYRHARADREFP